MVDKNEYIKSAFFLNNFEKRLKKLKISLKNEDGTYRNADDVITDIINVGKRYKR